MADLRVCCVLRPDAALACGKLIHVLRWKSAYPSEGIMSRHQLMIMEDKRWRRTSWLRCRISRSVMNPSQAHGSFNNRRVKTANGSVITAHTCRRDGRSRRTTTRLASRSSFMGTASVGHPWRMLRRSLVTVACSAGRTLGIRILLLSLHNLSLRSWHRSDKGFSIARHGRSVSRTSSRS